MSIKVKAKEGVRVPMEGNPRRHIQQTAVDVPETAYYHRQIMDGDLIVVTADEVATAPVEGATQQTDGKNTRNKKG